MQVDWSTANSQLCQVKTETLHFRHFPPEKLSQSHLILELQGCNYCDKKLAVKTTLYLINKPVLTQLVMSVLSWQKFELSSIHEVHQLTVSFDSLPIDFPPNDIRLVDDRRVEVELS